MGFDPVTIFAVAALVAGTFIVGNEIMSRMGGNVPQVDISQTTVGGGADLPAVSSPSHASAGGGGGKPSNTLANSPTYGWEGIKNTVYGGAPVPIIYGTHRVGGLVMNAYKETAGDSQYLNMLIGISEGPIAGVSALEVNGQPLENFSGVWWQYRPGILDQDPISYFRDIVTEYAVSAKVTTSGYTYTTNATGAQAVEVFVSFPQGLFSVEDRTDTQNYITDLASANNDISDQIAYENSQIAYRTDKLQTWQTAYSNALNVAATYSDPWNYYGVSTEAGGPEWFDGYLARCQSEIEAWTARIEAANAVIRQLSAKQTANSRRSVSASRTLTGDGVRSWSVTWGVYYRRHGSGAAWTEGKRQTVIETTKSQVRRSIRLDDLPAGRYDILIKRLSADSTSFRITDDLYLTAVDEIVYDDLEYPYTALIGIRALATDQLNGSMPNVTCLVQGRKVAVYDGATWTTEHSNNPAWVIYDLMTSTRYGLGNYVDAAAIDMDSFVEAAAWCDDLVDDGEGGTEKRATWDGVVDSTPSGWDLIQQIGSTFGAVLIYSDGLYKLKVAKPGTAVQVFGMSNIVKGSFSLSYKAINALTNAVDVQYSDAENNYRQDIVPIESAAAYTNAEPIRKDEVSLTGVVRRSQALRRGQEVLNVARLIRRKVEFVAGVDAIDCEVYDLIKVAHDLPLWAYSGRVRQAVGRDVHLSAPVTLAAGKSHSLLVRHADDTTEELSVTTGTGTWETITVAADWASQPAQDDVFHLYETGQAKTFRVTEIARSSDLHRKITAWEYSPDVWTYDGIVRETPNVSLLANPVLPPDPVENLTLTERLYYNAAGELKVAVDIYYNRPQELDAANPIYDHAEIHYSLDDGATWLAMGASPSNYATILDAIEGETYTVAVVAVSIRGAKRPIADAQQATITVQGKSKPPAAPSDFTAIQQGDQVKLSWTAVDELDVAGYVIREGTTWEAALPVVSLEPATSHSVTRTQNGTIRFWIKAVDTTGHYSDAVSAQVDVSGHVTNDIVSHDEMTAHAGAMSGWAYFGDPGEPGGLVNFSALTDQDIPNRTDQDAAISGYTGNAQTTLVYTTEAEDVGAVADCNVTLKLDLNATDNATDHSYPNRTDQTYPNDTDQNVTADISMTLEVNLSDDNVTWSGWQTFYNGVYSFRYIKWRLTVTVSATTRAVLESMLETIDVPDNDFWIAGLSVSASGTTVNYSAYNSRPFFSTPRVGPTSKTAALFPVITADSATGCTVTLYDTAGTAQAGTVDLFIDGY